MTTDWKQQHANESEKAVYHEIVQRVIDEQLFNLKAEGDSLVRYGLTKIAMYTAQVARAQALGFDPEALRMTPDEANEEMIALARRMVEAGKPVIVVEVSNDDR